MKKILFLLAMLPMMFACSSDDDKLIESLAGTVWESYDKWDNFEAIRVITFKNETSCHVKVEEKTNGKVDYSSSATGSYEYMDNVVIIKWQDGYSESGVINGNKMTLTGKDGYSETFTKK